MALNDQQLAGLVRDGSLALLSAQRVSLDHLVALAARHDSASVGDVASEAAEI
jgi:hypothetical protein